MQFEKLDRVIKLQRLEFTAHADSGEPVLTVAEEIPVWAQKKALQGIENFRAEAERAKGFALWYIRYRPEIDSQNYRIKDEAGQIWDIMGEPREIGRREGWEIPAQRNAGS